MHMLTTTPFKVAGFASVRSGRRALRAPAARAQGGVAILEALIAILIFSIGILGMVGLQARSVQGLGEASYRSQAVQHASELISEMWLTDPGLRAGLYSSAPAGTRYTSWSAKVAAGSRMLPGAGNFPPIVVVNTVQQAVALLPGTSYTYTDVTITVRWLPPGSPAGSAPSQYITTARILEPQS